MQFSSSLVFKNISDSCFCESVSFLFLLQGQANVRQISGQQEGGNLENATSEYGPDDEPEGRENSAQRCENGYEVDTSSLGEAGSSSEEEEQEEDLFSSCEDNDEAPLAADSDAVAPVEAVSGDSDSRSESLWRGIQQETRVCL